MFGIDAKALIALFNDNPWWILLFTIFLFALGIWGKLNWEALNGHEKKPESFEWAIQQLKENNWGRLYLDSLGWVLDKISGWIGDREKLDQIYEIPGNPEGFVQKFFGFNPFTPESYEKCLRLAFLYPVLSFLICWAMGGTGQVGSVDFLRQEASALEIWQRMLVIVGLSAGFSIGFWLLFRWNGWRRWLLLFLLSLVLSTVSVFSKESFLAVLFGIWFVFLWLFLPIYGGGCLTGLLVYRSRKIAHESIYLIAVAIIVLIRSA
ncbi:MAG: hypothetical protein ACU843_15800 [Gammaproteobacteria bacterium]